MIGKPELLGTAVALGLRPDVVEKDYALGWALAGIYAHEELAESWVFKGGTCLKKCYFETYRFSEDLDFTLKDGAHLDEAFLKRAFAQISEWIYEHSGLEFPADSQDFEIIDKSSGKRSCQGKLSYRGPVSPKSGGLPRIKLDLTADERLVLAPVTMPVFHPYSDEPEAGIAVLTYAYEEAFGEKVRALAERTRPRDLYDVINLYRNVEARPSPAVLLDVLRQKCEFKGIRVPQLAELEAHRPELEGAWENMLAHQLPELPPVASFWDALPEFFEWLVGATVPAMPAAYAMGAGETVLRERTLRLPVGARVQPHLEVIRFAAANRLCVELDYRDEQGRSSTRLIEPYSLRRTQDDNILLHAWNVDRNQHRSYRVDRIQGARSTNRVFTPRYAVELTPSGLVSIPMAQRTSSSFGGAGRAAPTRAVRAPAKRSPSFGQGPTYVYECGVCGNKFRHKTQSAKLNKHKGQGGFPCPGRTGYLVDVKY